ncbi:7140_t:CDS:2, partial [Ambispora gerdemannii]
MSDFEFTYMNFEECSAFEENSDDDIFIVDQVALASAQAILNDVDENDNIDWSEIEPEDSGSSIVDIIQGEVKCCDGTANLRRLEQMIGTWEIDADAVKDVKNNLHQLG